MGLPPEIHANGALEADNRDPSEVRNVLNIFLSYSHGDEEILKAVYECLQDTLDRGLTNIIWDGKDFQAGAALRDEIKTKLDETDVLIPIYSGRMKNSFSFPGFEWGYFEGAGLRNRPVAEIDHRIVPICVRDAPPADGRLIYIGLELSEDSLRGDVESYLGARNINADHIMVQRIRGLQRVISEIRRRLRIRDIPHPDPEPVVRETYKKIFNALRKQKELVVLPQRQLRIRTSDDSLKAINFNEDLPMDAILEPFGSEPAFTLFGIASKEMKWSDFCANTVNSVHAHWWRDALALVVMSSLPRQIHVDNSQIIMGNDDKMYRVVLTESTLFYDGRRHFLLSFVEIVPRKDYGDKDTTTLLKAMDLVLRYRFLFLEQSSPYSPEIFALLTQDDVAKAVGDLITELNWIRRDGRLYALYDPRTWTTITDFARVDAMIRAWRPLAEQIRLASAKIKLASREAGPLTDLQNEFVTILGQTREAIRSHNCRLIEEIAGKLKALASR